MSTLAPADSVQAATRAPPRLAVPKWLREPLLHFVVLGALLFAADHLTLARSPRFAWARAPALYVIGSVAAYWSLTRIVGILG